MLDAARAAASGRLLAEVLAAVRAAAPGQPVLVHSAPRSARRRARTPATTRPSCAARAAPTASCWAAGTPSPPPDLVARTAAAAPPGARIAAVLQAVAGLGGQPGTLAAQAAAVRAAGATELRVYHAGLAAQADLAAIATFCHAAGVAPRSRAKLQPS